MDESFPWTGAPRTCWPRPVARARHVHRVCADKSWRPKFAVPKRGAPPQSWGRNTSCPACSGTGWLDRRVHIFGMCPLCHGMGDIPEKLAIPFVQAIGEAGIARNRYKGAPEHEPRKASCTVKRTTAA